MIFSRPVKPLRLLLVSLVFCLALHLGVRAVSAASTSVIQGRVKISVCGNDIVEGKEDCEGNDLRNKICQHLGFTSGTLSCDQSCSFITSSCIKPSVVSSNVLGPQMPTLSAVNLFKINSTGSFLSTPGVTVAEETTIHVNDVVEVQLPKDMVIQGASGSWFDPTSFSTDVIPKTSVQSIDEEKIVGPVLQWGIAGQSLVFSEPASINMTVGDEYDGMTLTIFRSSQLISGWTNDGIVAPGTCVVANGVCGFQTTKASYFTALSDTPVPNNTNSSSQSNDSVSTSDLCSRQKPVGSPYLVSVSTGRNQVTLAWSGGISPVDGYLLTYGLSPNEMRFGNPNIGQVNVFTVNDLPGESWYHFRVLPLNGCQPGVFSNEIAVFVPGDVRERVPQDFSPSIEAFSETGVLVGEQPDDTRLEFDANESITPKGGTSQVESSGKPPSIFTVILSFFWSILERLKQMFYSVR